MAATATTRSAVLISFVSILATGAVANAASAKILEASGGGVSFLAVGRPSAVKIRGKGTMPKGKVSVGERDVSGDFDFDMTSLDTGIDLRTRHMKEKYLETEKFPKASFKITKMTLPAPLTGAGFKAENVPLEGTLTLHGVTHPVSAVATILGTAAGMDAHVEFKTEISQYGISVPSYLGITVADSVEVQVDLTAAQSGSAAK